jgi:hypothetical protein
MVFVLAAVTCGRNELSTPTSPTGVGLPSALFESAPGDLASLSVDPSVFKGGTSSRGTVTLTSAAPAGGVTVALSSDDTAAAVPSSIVVAAGATSATFSITTKAVTSDVRIKISASAGGITRLALIRLTPRNGLASFTIDPTVIRAGDTATGTVTLSGTAPAGGTVVRLTSEVDDARLPATVTVAEGAKTATFTIRTYDVSKATEIWIHASAGDDRLSVQIRVVSAAPISGGTGSVTLGGKID